MKMRKKLKGHFRKMRLGYKIEMPLIILLQGRRI